MRRIHFLCISLLMSLSVWAQQNWFVDGYHGGVYGHYPMQWYTRFLCEQLESHPQWKFGLEIEPETWDTVQARTPEDYLRFQQLATGTQMEYTNPSYAQSYLYCIQGESIIRQFQYGIRHIRQHFPQMQMLTYASEEPCFTSCLPTLLPQLGFRYVVLKCPDTCWGGYAAPFGGQFVSLVGPAGNAMLCVPRYACEALQPKSTWQTLAWQNQKIYWEACRDAGIQNPVGMCYQDAGWKGGPWIGYGDKVRFGTKYTLWTEYFQQFGTDAEAPQHRFSQEDVRPGLVWGSQILQRLAQQVRHSENHLLQTEKLSAIRSMRDGTSVSVQSLDEAWRQLLLSQHHDCWIVPYNRLNKRGNWAQNVALWTASADSISDSLRGKAGETFYNTTAFPRNEVVETERGVFAVEVPAMGCTTKCTTATPKHSIQIKSNKCSIQNDLYRLTLDLQQGGVFSSLFDRSSKTEFAPANSDFRLGEIRGFFRVRNAFCSSMDHAATATVLMDNSLLKRVRVEGIVADVPFTEIITLKTGDPIIDFDLTLDWKGGEQVGDTSFYDTRYMLRYMLPTLLGETSLTKGAPFDVCPSQQDHSYYRTWDDIRHNLILDWLDVQSRESGSSLALFSDHTTSYTWAPNEPLALTLQYAGPGLWGRDYRISGPTHIHFALMPHSGDWQQAELPLQIQRWNEPLLPLEGQTETFASGIDFTGTGYLLTTALPTETGLIVRLYNAYGDNSPREIHLPKGTVKVIRTDLLDNTQEEIPIRDGSIQLTLPLHDVVQLLLSRSVI